MSTILNGGWHWKPVHKMAKTAFHCLLAPTPSFTVCKHFWHHEKINICCNNCCTIMQKDTYSWFDNMGIECIWYVFDHRSHRQVTQSQHDSQNLIHISQRGPQVLRQLLTSPCNQSFLLLLCLLLQSYKRKTEAAKKEYLKALAAYRASLVSKVTMGVMSLIYMGQQQYMGW